MTTVEIHPAEIVGLQSVDPRSIPIDVEIVVPVYNEAAHLAERIMELRQFLDTSFPFQSLVTVVDNGSTDDSYAIAAEMATTLTGVAAIHLTRKGRGFALRSAWSTSAARIVAYMDVDLSTSLPALLPLVAPLLSGHRDVAIGTRLARGSHVVRGPKRELISRSYNLLLKLLLHGGFSDAQCGFKALQRDAALQLLPLVEDDEWFFDTELLVIAKRLGLRFCEVPVDWVDDPDSRVRIVPTAINDLRGVWRISHGRSANLIRQQGSERTASFGQVTADQLLPFAGVGAISTLAFLFLFLAGRPAVGTLVANASALALCTVFNAAAHRELSHSIEGQAQKRRFMAAVAGLFVVSLVLTTASLFMTQLLVGVSLPFALLAVTSAYAVSAVIRFTVLRAWVFRPTGSSLSAPAKLFA